MSCWGVLSPGRDEPVGVMSLWVLSCTGVMSCWGVMSPWVLSHGVCREPRPSSSGHHAALVREPSETIGA